MVGWHQGFNGHELGETPGGGEGQGGLACRRPWGHIEASTSWRPSKEKRFTHNREQSWSGCFSEF